MDASKPQPDPSLSAEHAREIEVQQGEGLYAAFIKLRDERDALLAQMPWIQNHETTARRITKNDLI